jgi:dTDP-4-amino-4,6-dideoxygalactose transaminase
MSMAPPPSADRHRVLLDYYDDRLRLHGDSAQGAGWPNEHDRVVRFEALTEPLRCAPYPPSPVVCDLGCGTGELLRYLKACGRADIGYVGADRSAQALALARAKFPEARWIEIDVSTAPDSALDELACDYLVANGLFTVRHELSHEAMWDFMTGVLERLWPRVRRGISFNVMSPVVDWERDDLFHVSHDRIARLLHGLAGRRVQMRADYGLYEYMCVAFKPPPPTVVEKLGGSTASASSDRTNLSGLAGSHRPAPARLAAYRPLLPPAERLLPYLRRMDATRVYSNNGPLVGELERRLGGQFGLDAQQVVCASSGTSALVAAVLAHAGRARPERPYALCPAYTFVGTASALQQCGYVPWLVDVDRQTWQLDPRSAAAHPMLERCGVVMPVAANGRPVPIPAWDLFRETTGVPVVVDGAASFEGLLRDPSTTIGQTPVALSFHATKVFTTGEGGSVITRDADLARRVLRATNFGFRLSRESQGPSINGKMSELHAAVGLASLDEWPSRQLALQTVNRDYREAFAARGLAADLVCHPDVASSYVLLALPDEQSCQRLSGALAAIDVETRLWYGRGLHRQPAMADLPRDELPVTDRLAATLLGLPVAPDLARSDIDRVADSVVHACRQAAVTAALP